MRPFAKFGKDKSMTASLTKTKIVHGIEVKKMPTRQYVAALNKLSGMVPELLDAAFPGATPSDVLSKLVTLSVEDFRALCVRLITVLPAMVLNVMCSIMDVDFDTAMDTLTPAELMRVWQAFWELNDLTDFFMSVRSSIPQALGTNKANTGSNV